MDTRYEENLRVLRKALPNEVYLVSGQVIRRLATEITEREEIVDIELFGFDMALQRMREHAIVRRHAWAEKGMVVLLVSFGGELRLCKKLKTGSIGLWAATQDDLLASDWEVV